MAESLADLLLRTGLLTSAELAAARAEAARTGKRLADSVIDLGLVDERRFAESIAQAGDASIVDPIPEDAAAAVYHHIPKAVARELQVVPLRLVDRELFVVMVNPLDREAIDVLQAVTTRTIHPLTGIRSEVARLVNRFYPADSTPFEEAPFDFSSETLLRRPPELDFLRDPAPPRPDEEFGTMIAPPAKRERETLPPLVPAGEPQRVDGDSTAPTNPIVGIERRLDQIVGMIHNIEKRLDRLESLFHDHGTVNR